MLQTPYRSDLLSQSTFAAPKAREAKRSIAKVFVWVIGFTLLTTPQINIPGPEFARSLDVWAGLALVLLLATQKRRFTMSAALFRSLIAIGGLLSYVLVLGVVFQEGDYTGHMMFGRMVATILVAYAFVVVTFSLYQEKQLEFFFQLVIATALIQGSVLLLSFTFIEFRDFLSALFYRDTDPERAHLVNLRVPGFVATGGDGLSMNQALMCAVATIGCMYLSPSKPRRWLILLLILAMATVAFTGRIGLYLGVVTFGLIFLARNYRVLKNATLLSLILLFAASVTYAAKAEITAYVYVLLEEHGYEYPIVRLLRGFIEYEITGEYDDGTFRMFFYDMIIVPRDVVRFLLGNGNFGQQAHNFVSSDIGYIRMWHGMGLLGMASATFASPLLPTYCGIMLIRKNPQLFGGVKGQTIALLLYVILFFGLIAHAKIFYTTTRIYVFVLFCVVFIIDLRRRRELARPTSRSCNLLLGRQLQRT